MIVDLYNLGFLFLSSAQKIMGYDRLKTEIALLRITVPLSMFCLDCLTLNADLCVKAGQLRERVIQFEVDQNRDLNRA